MSARQKTPHSTGDLPLSVLDIGRQIRVASDEYDRQDELLYSKGEKSVADKHAIKCTQSLAYDRLDALSDLALTLPAQTLGDAAVHAALASDIIDRIEACDITKSDFTGDFKQLRRALRSILPVIAREAGLALAEIAGDTAEEFCAREFPPIGNAA